jgi:hypothetical protein
LCPEPRKVKISECRGTCIYLLGKVREVVIENCKQCIILAEATNGIDILFCEALTLVAGGSVVPVVKVEISCEVSVIAHIKALRNLLETHASIGVTLFAVHDVSPSSSPE